MYIIYVRTLNYIIYIFILRTAWRSIKQQFRSDASISLSLQPNLIESPYDDPLGPGEIHTTVRAHMATYG